MLSEFTPVSALAGGSLLGIAAVLLLKLNGRIAGVSGILNTAFTAGNDDRLWRILFISGVVFGGFVYQAATNVPLLTREGFPLWQLIPAGLLVGIGTRLGSGCTSGHGVCGIARLSLRSMVATATFLIVGMGTATLMYLANGSAS